ncbi:MAG: endolytic transglycosylase MltG [Elusimicrobiota bacterium]|jgi:UPF0755 protein|nr:endolytic transglycosylase MltG [Elusimicrobiota bacterium]
MKKNRKLLILPAVIILLLLVAAPVSVYLHYFNKGDTITVEIPEGMPGVKIAELLKDNGIIKSPLWFKICLKLSNSAPLLRSGVFKLNKNTSAEEVIWRLTNDSGAQLFRVVVLEGWRIEEIAEALQKAGIIEQTAPFIQAAKEQEVEGYLFPSTYLLPKNMPPVEIIKVMTGEYKKNIAPVIQAANPSLNEIEILTVASIVEREALVDDERPKIAAVYLNRLKIGKRLEADPTVQYALGFNNIEARHWKKGLTLKDLRFDSPYNTYRYRGIPPGPIASPSLSSVKAVLNPEPNFDALYFVADNTGRHIFSKTYDQHVQNIRRIRRKK